MHIQHTYGCTVCLRKNSISMLDCKVLCNSENPCCGHFITDPNLSFFLIIVHRWYEDQVWLVRTVESKSYLREYNVVGVRWCRYSCNCT